MNLSLEGKTVLVIGASRGVGLTVVCKLAGEGTRVVGVAHTVTPEFRDVSKPVVSAGLSTPDGAEAAVKAALAELGGIDILINNVGVGDPDVMKLGGFLEIDDAQWHDLFNPNFFSAVWMSYAALPSLLERRDAVVNTESTNALVPARGPIGRSEAKVALMAFDKCLDEELRP